MRKKILATMLMLVTAVGTITGCGAGATNEIYVYIYDNNDFICIIKLTNSNSTILDRNKWICGYSKYDN